MADQPETMDQSGQQKRKRGRPRKVQPDAAPETPVESAAKRPRGRPRKAPQEDVADDSDVPTAQRPGKRPRGRPRKAPRQDVAEDEDSQGPPVGDRPRTRAVRSRRVVLSESENESGSDADDDVGEVEEGDVPDLPIPRGSRSEATAGWIPTTKSERRACEEMESRYHTTLELAKLRNKKKPRMNKDSMEARSHLFYSYDHEGTGLWTDSLESQVAQEWEECPETTALDKVHNFGRSMSSIFKICLDLFKIDPLSLMSFYSDFDYDNSDSDAIMHRGVSITNPLWTYNFCDKLHKAVAHPLFRSKGAYRLIPLVIKWAVIVRLDDRKGFGDDEQRMLAHVGCPDLGRGVSDRKMTERHLESQKRLTRGGLCVTPFADLLITIGQQVTGAATPNMDGRLGTKTVDISAVIDALDSLIPDGVTVPCQVHYDTYMASRTQRGYPSGPVELKEAYKKAWKNVARQSICRREIEKAAAGTPSQAQPAVLSSDGFEAEPEGQFEAQANSEFDAQFEVESDLESNGRDYAPLYPGYEYQPESPHGLPTGTGSLSGAANRHSSPREGSNATPAWLDEEAAKYDGREDDFVSTPAWLDDQEAE